MQTGSKVERVCDTRSQDEFAAAPIVALFLADRGEGERAVELYALASRRPHVSNSPWFEDVAGKHTAAVAAGGGHSSAGTRSGAGPGEPRWQICWSSQEAASFPYSQGDAAAIPLDAQ